MKNLIASFVRDEQGQDLIEYTLLAGFISLAVVTAVTNVGTALNALYDTVETGKTRRRRLLVPVKPCDLAPQRRVHRGFAVKEARQMSLAQFVLEEDGQDLVEYALLAAFISLAVVASIDAVGGALGHDVSVLFTRTSTRGRPELIATRFCQAHRGLDLCVYRNSARSGPCSRKNGART